MDNKIEKVRKRRGLKRFYIVRKNRKRLKRFGRFVLLYFRSLYLRRFHSATGLYQLKSTSEFVMERGLTPLVVAPSLSLEIPGPQFIGRRPGNLHAMPTVQLVMPKIEVVELPMTTVMAGSNFVLADDIAIHPDLFLPFRDVAPAETHGIATIDLARNLISITSFYEPRKIERAISLLGQCAGNYAHWLTETLPKLLIINDLPQFDGLPIIVDGWIHPIFLQTITLLDKQKRKIILLERWRLLRVTSLVDISPTAYIPPALRGFEKGHILPPPDPCHYVFSRMVLDKLRKVGLAASSRKVGFGKKIYLHREKGSTGNSRLIENDEALESIIVEYGFVPVNPAKFTFEEQIAIFSQAERIIAPVGAALANTIFSPPGCSVVAMAAYYQNADYYYFSNLMGALGHRLYYIVGPQVENAGNILHRNYEIDISNLRHALEEIEELCHS